MQIGVWEPSQHKDGGKPKKKRLVTDAALFWQTAVQETHRFLGICNMIGSHQHHTAIFPLYEFISKHVYCES